MEETAESFTDKNIRKIRCQGAAVLGSELQWFLPAVGRSHSGISARVSSSEHAFPSSRCQIQVCFSFLCGAIAGCGILKLSAVSTNINFWKAFKVILFRLQKIRLHCCLKSQSSFQGWWGGWSYFVLFLTSDQAMAADEEVRGEIEVLLPSSGLRARQKTTVGQRTMLIWGNRRGKGLQDGHGDVEGEDN